MKIMIVNSKAEIQNNFQKSKNPKLDLDFNLYFATVCII